MNVAADSADTTPAEASRGGLDRRSILLAVVGGVGMVVGIIALVIAISAKNASQSDAKVTAQVNHAAQVALAGVRAQLTRDATSAAALLRHLQTESNQAARSRRALLTGISQNRGGVAANRSGVAANRSGVAANRTNIANLQASVDTLTGDVQNVSDSVNNLKTSQDDLNKRVTALEQASTP